MSDVTASYGMPLNFLRFLRILHTIGPKNPNIWALMFCFNVNETSYLEFWNLNKVLPEDRSASDKFPRR